MRILFALLLLLPFTAQAAVFFDDDFEASLTTSGWNDLTACTNFANNATVLSQACLLGAGHAFFHNNPARVNAAQAIQPFGTAVSGSWVMETNFDGPTWPDGGFGTKGKIIYRHHTNVGSGAHYWLRFWMKLSSNFVGFVSGNGFSKTIYINQGSGGLAPVVEVLNSRRIMMSWQGGGVPLGYPSTNLFSNLAFNPALNVNQWYCLEFHIGMASAPNVADGLYEAWIDGTKTANYPNLATHKNTVPIKWTTIYAQQADAGSKFIDNLGVGSTRLGCAGVPPATPTAPAAPTLFIQSTP